jgi:cytochrome bd-type quinol oxidase subunit 2
MSNMEPGSSGGLFASLEEEQHKRHFWSARVATLIVSVVYILNGIFTWISLERKITDAKGTLNPTAVSETRLLIWIMIGIGVVFGILYFWARSNPFKANIIALVIYITTLLIEIGVDPERLGRGILVKVLITIALVNGVWSAFVYQKRKGE